MNKTILLVLACFLSFSSCKNDNDDHGLSNKEIVEKYRETFDDFYEKIDLETLTNKDDLKSYFSSEYTNTYGSSADITAFNNGYNQGLNAQQNNNPFVLSKVEQAIADADSANDVIETLVNLSNDESIKLEDRIQFAITAESFEYVEENAEYINVTLLGNKMAQGEVFKKAAWWKKWGKCVFGTVGGGVVGAATVGLAAAAITAIPTVGIGALPAGVIGGVVGAVGGGMSGASSSCK